MNGRTVYEVVTKLIGPIDPIGETNADDDRFDNLKELAILVDKLVYDIDAVIPNKRRAEFSMKRAGEYADNFLTKSLGIAE